MAKELDFSVFLGGVRSGKSTEGAFLSMDDIFNRPDELGGIFANTNKQLTQATLVEFAKVLAWHGVFQDKHYVINKNPNRFFDYQSRFPESHDGVWSFINGKQFYTFSLDTHFRGYEFGHVWGDEVQDAKKILLDVVFGRMSGSKEPRIHITMTPPRDNPDIDAMVYDENGQVFSNVSITTTYDNKTLPKSYFKMIERWDQITFRREVMCERILMDGMNFMYSFDRKKHVSDKARYQPDKLVYFSIDFNTNPFVCTLAHRGINEQGKLYIHYFDTIILNPSQINDGGTHVQALCNEIKARTLTQASKNAYRITGDQNSGRQGHVLLKVGQKIWDVIMKNFGYNYNLLQTSRSNMGHGESRHLCNSIFSTYPEILVNPKCKELIRDLEFVKAGKDGQIIKNNRQDVLQQADLLDALRYDLHAFNGDYLG